MRKTPHCSFKDVLTRIPSFFRVCCCTLNPLPKGEACIKHQWEVSDTGKKPRNWIVWIPRHRRGGGATAPWTPSYKDPSVLKCCKHSFPKMTRAWTHLAFYVSFVDLWDLKYKQLLPAEFASLKHHSLYSLQNAWISGLCKGWLQFILWCSRPHRPGETW